ncbi:hypothetical protein MTR67_034992 [Solanum verrucosum]|uniref:Uncharacterized protein n=1 Tax=Solanum verrucosum TaxID=315347 RepID=A0AAF0U959_SOLVR|nr:hypothetical protein MTR67_034992 [Solanum verrucosum]
MAERNSSNCGIEHKTYFGQILLSISWPLLNSLFRKPVTGRSNIYKYIVTFLLISSPIND